MQNTLNLDEKIMNALSQHLVAEFPNTPSETISAIVEGVRWIFETVTTGDGSVENLPLGIATIAIPNSSSVDQTRQIVSNLQTDVQTATQKADAAQGAAGQAQMSANAAQTAAGQAGQAAEVAQQTATQAQNTARAANSTANEAKGLAEVTADDLAKVCCSSLMSNHG